MKYAWLKEQNDVVYFNGDERLEIYIPSSYFEKNMAEHKGNEIKSLGIYTFYVYLKEGEKVKPEKHTLKIPMPIQFNYSKTYTIKTSINDKSIEKYEVFVLEKGNIFLDNLNREQSAANAKDFVFMIHSGKFPSIIRYDEIPLMYLESVTLNKTKINNPASILEMTIAELARCGNDITYPFRVDIGREDSKSTMLDYKFINIVDLPSINSTFAALAFEDMNASILNSIRKTKTGENEIESPVEKVIKY